MRALIVDDSPTARALARVALEEAADSLGLTLDVDEADGGVEALRMLATSSIEVLIVDLHMPDVHGLEVLNFWRRRLNQAVGAPLGIAVVVSTEVSDRDRQKAAELGASAFVPKPVSGPAFSAALSALLDTPPAGDGGGTP